MEKLCMFCVHLDYEAIGMGPDYSEVTSGDPYGGFTCKRSHFHEERPGDVAEFRSLILTAQDCKDYDQVEA